MADARYSQSLERGLAILGCFGATRPLLGIAEIAEELGMSRSTTHRYAVTLVALGYLEQGPSRKYRLGLRVSDLGLAALSGSGLREQARPYLEDLRSQTSYTAGLAALDGADVRWLDTAAGLPRSNSISRELLHAGVRMPAHSTAEGKLLLAYLPPPLQKELLADAKLAKQGPSTITGKRALLEELEAIREAGFAVADEEQAAGVLALSAPVRDVAGEVVAAVSLTVDSSVITVGQLVDALSPHVIACADRVSARIGFRREDERRQR